MRAVAELDHGPAKAGGRLNRGLQDIVVGAEARVAFGSSDELGVGGQNPGNGRGDRASGQQNDRRLVDVNPILRPRAAYGARQGRATDSASVNDRPGGRVSIAELASQDAVDRIAEVFSLRDGIKKHAGVDEGPGKPTGRGCAIPV